MRAGLSSGFTSHLYTSSESTVAQNTLSGLEYLFDHMCCNVGMPLGSDMTMSYSASNPIKSSALRVACCVNK